MAKSSSRPAAAKSSTAAAFSSSSNTTRSSKSSILKTSFAPAELRLSLIASTIINLDSEQLRIHDTITGELKSEYTVQGTSINCIVWGRYPRRADGTPGKKKKRKLNEGQAIDSTNDVVVIAIGTRDGDIVLWSPLEATVVATLQDAHAKGTRDFAFEPEGKASSLGVDGSVISWDLATGTKHDLSRPSLTPLGLRKLTKFNSSLILASQNVYLFDPESADLPEIQCFQEAIHSLIPQPASKFPSQLFIAAAESQLHVSVYNIETRSLTGSFNVGDPVRSLALNHKSQGPILAAITEAGTVQLFDAPFSGWSVLENDDIKTKRRKQTRRADATVEVRRADKSAQVVSVLDAEFDADGNLVLALADGSASLGFERILATKEDGSLVLTGTQTISRAKSANLVNDSMNGVKNMKHAHIDQSRDIISNGVVDSTEEAPKPKKTAMEASDEEDEEDEDQMPDAESTALVQTNGATDDDEEMADAAEEEEPTFGELLRARNNGAIIAADSNQALLPTADRPLSSGLTLGTLLTQALNTNDSASLDTCLAQQDLQVIRATIERLDSSLAITLLHRLAERLHSRPGRAGSLLMWVQWTIVAHGGYLSSRQDTIQQLRSLHKVVQQRAKSLQPLLSLKGKLDMLDAQLALRKRMQQAQRSAAAPIGRPEDMIYIEGQEESDSDDEQSQQGLLEDGRDIDDEEDDEDEGGVDLANVDEDDDSEEEDDDEEGSIISDENQIDGEVNHDDLDPMSDEDEDDYQSIGAGKVNGTKNY